MAKNPRKDRKPIQEPQYDLENLVSATEYTGIAPAPIQNGGMVDSYATMFSVATPLFAVSDPGPDAVNPDYAMDRKKEEASKRAREEDNS